MRQLQLQKQDRLFSNKSQTAIEVLISIVIFTTAFIALVTLANNYLLTLKTIRERVLANFLAHEGLELVIAKRNMEQKNFNLAGNYCADYTLNFIPSSASSGCLLYINNDNFYNHVAGTSTIFKRLISISPQIIASATIYYVTSSVYVYDNNKPLVELTTIITQWPF